MKLIAFLGFLICLGGAMINLPGMHLGYIISYIAFEICIVCAFIHLVNLFFDGLIFNLIDRWL